MSGKVVPVKIPGFDQEKAEAFVQAGIGADARAAPAAKTKMKRFTIDVPEELHTRVKIECAKRGLYMADEVRRFLEREFPTT